MKDKRKESTQILNKKENVSHSISPHFIFFIQSGRNDDIKVLYTPGGQCCVKLNGSLPKNMLSILTTTFVNVDPAHNSRFEGGDVNV